MAAPINTNRYRLILLLYLVFICLSLLSVPASLLESNLFVIKTLSYQEQLIKRQLDRSGVLMKEVDPALLKEQPVLEKYVLLQKEISASYAFMDSIEIVILSSLKKQGTSIEKEYASRKKMNALFKKDSMAQKIQQNLFSLSDLINRYDTLLGAEFSRWLPATSKATKVVTLSANTTTTASNNTIEFQRIWEHANLNNTGHVAPAGSTIDIGLRFPDSSFNSSNNPVVGVFIYRNTAGSGNNNFNKVQLRWNYGQQDIMDDSLVSVQVFAVEMVYVPQGSFYVGSGSSGLSNREDGSFHDGVIRKAIFSTTISGGQVTSTTILDGGAGYEEPVSLSLASSSPAAVTSNLTNGVVTSITITNPGAGFTTGSTYDFRNPPSRPLQITSENALTISNTAGNLWGASTTGNATIGSAGTLPAAFPKGFKAFYCMKYELTQGQYRDFLNLLTRTQQANRVATAISAGTATTVTNRYVLGAGTGTPTVVNRNGIRCDATVDANNPINFYCDLNQNGTGNEADDGEWIACNFLGNPDHCAYLDWAGLRPMTELEFEKACRGDQIPVEHEYAWGNSSRNLVGQAISSSGRSSEAIATNYSLTSGNMNHSTNNLIGGPARVGIYAANSYASRMTSGASYWGIMELSGNVAERIVSVGLVEGRNYTGLHGDGSLNRDGNANQSFWPGLISGQVTGHNGSGARGSAFLDSESRGRVSDRALASMGSGHTRSTIMGCRGVRTAP